MMKNPFSLEGKNILITGASSGIGRQCAISCSQMGAKVILIARNEERLKETFEQLDGEGHTFFSLDLTDYEKLSSCVNRIIAEYGPLHGVLHCAGISTTLPLKLMEGEKLEEFFRTNVFSAIQLTREVCKMKNFSKEGGSIVFFSSVMGCVGESGKSLYSMTKGALISGMRSLAVEYAKKKIRFNCVSPGVIVTPINMNQSYMQDPIKRKIEEDKHLLGFGQTEDVANACIYLLSEASRWVTGQNLIVDGGYTTR